MTIFFKSINQCSNGNQLHGNDGDFLSNGMHTKSFTVSNMSAIGEKEEIIAPTIESHLGRY